MKAKEHLEEMVEITKKIGYGDVLPKMNKDRQDEGNFEIKFQNQKERE